MNVRNRILSVLLTTLTAAATAQEEGDEAKVRHLDPRPLARATKVSLTKAIRTALELQPGIAVQAEIEGEVKGETTHVFYEVMVLDKDGNPFEVLVDPDSGEGKVKPAQEPAEEIAAFRTMAAKAKLSLEAMVKSAAKLVRGKAMVAKLELEDDAVEARIVFTVETHDLSVVIEAAGGKLEEIEGTPVGAKKQEREEGEEEGEEGEAGKEGKEAKAGKGKRGQAKEEHEREEAGEQAEGERAEKAAKAKSKGKQAK